MGILIDGNLLIALERKGLELSSRIAGREQEEVFLSVISASELLHGVHRAATPNLHANRLAFVEAVLASFPLLEIDLATARSHALLWSQLAQRGKMIGIHDSWLAAQSQPASRKNATPTVHRKSWPPPRCLNHSNPIIQFDMFSHSI